MRLFVSAGLGAMVAVGLLAAVASVRGIQLFPGLSASLVQGRGRLERLSIWLLIGLVVGAAVWFVTGWPVAGLWAVAAALSTPLLNSTGRSASGEIDRVDAVATWCEQIRDTMSASAGLQQALIATAVNGPEPIAPELRNFARRAPRGDLASALRQLGRDLDHPSADMVVAGLIAATELDAGRLVPLLSRLASSIRDEARMRVRIEVGRARVRTSMRIVAFFVVLTILLLAVAGGELLDGYRSVVGQLWLVVVGMFVVAAGWATRKLGEVPQPERFVARRRIA